MRSDVRFRTQEDSEAVSSPLSTPAADLSRNRRSRSCDWRSAGMASAGLVGTFPVFGGVRHLGT
jgi:hypothetical protein